VVQGRSCRGGCVCYWTICLSGNARGGCNCSCVVVTIVKEEWDAYRHLSNHLAAQRAEAAS